MVDKKHRIVIIDDNKEFLKLLKDYFNMSNKYTVIGLEGLTDINKLLALNPSIVLLDLNMPTMSGEKILKSMKEIPELVNIPVILVTALKKLTSQEILNMAQVVIEKPASLVELDSAVTFLLSSYY